MSDTTEIVCPKCGSNQLSADKRGFSTGNAIKGVAAGLVGVPGGVLWGLKGKDNIIITCLKCGKQFKPGEGKAITHREPSNTTPAFNPQVEAKLIAQEMEKARELYEKEERKKEREKARNAKEREREKKERAEIREKEKEHADSITIESVLKRKVSAANYKDLDIFIGKLNKEIKRISQLKESPERQENIQKMTERINEIQSEISAREKEAERKEARRLEKKELKVEIKNAEKELLAAKEDLIKVSAYHLLRSEAQKEKQVQEQQKLINAIEKKIFEMNARFSDDQPIQTEPNSITQLQ